MGRTRNSESSGGYAHGFICTSDLIPTVAAALTETRQGQQFVTSPPRSHRRCRLPSRRQPRPFDSLTNHEACYIINNNNNNKNKVTAITRTFALYV